MNQSHCSLFQRISSGACCWSLSCVYMCRGFRVVTVALGSFCCFLCTGMALATFDGWLNMKTLGCILWGSRETVMLPFPLCSRVDWQWWIDRRSSRPQHSKVNNPSLTTSRKVLSGKWTSFGKWQSLYFSGSPHTLPTLSPCRSSITPRFMRVYWSLCACLCSLNRPVNGKQ